MVMVNGNPVSNAEKMTLKDYLTSERYILTHIAVECNGKIIPREAFGQIRLRDGDSVEIIHFMGGGSCRAHGLSSRRQE